MRSQTAIWLRTIQNLLILLTVVGTISMKVFAEERASKDVIVFNDNGGWCWYQDERAIVHAEKLVFGSVAHASGTNGTARAGNVEITTHDLRTGKTDVTVLDANYEADDHCVPALYVRKDGRLLAVYSGHDTSENIHTKLSKVGDIRKWEQRQVVPAGDLVCYANLHFLERENNGSGRLYNFYRRGTPFTQYYFYSDDEGVNWTHGGEWLHHGIPNTRERPYVKYASNGLDTIHFVFTEAHPASHGATSIYHAYYRDGHFHASDGTRIKSLANAPLYCHEATRIFQGGKNNAAWTIDLHLDAAGNPYTVYSVHKKSGDIDPDSPNRADHRYRYARWDGQRWHDYALAHGGTHICDDQPHYNGLAAVDPANPNTVYVSTNVDPASGQPTGTRKHEIYRGTTKDGGNSWKWQAITANSPSNNLRPVVTLPSDGRQALLWTRGTYVTFTDFDSEIVGFMLGDSP